MRSVSLSVRDSCKSERLSITGASYMALRVSTSVSSVGKSRMSANYISVCVSNVSMCMIRVSMCVSSVSHV